MKLFFYLLRAFWKRRKKIKAGIYSVGLEVEYHYPGYNGWYRDNYSDIRLNEIPGILSVYQDCKPLKIIRYQILEYQARFLSIEIKYPLGHA